MKITKYLMGMGLVAAMAMTSCSNDEPAQNIPATDGGGEQFYATVSLSLPTVAGSRSQTDNPGDDYVTSTDGQEIGKDYENNIKSILVILATYDGSDFVLQTVNQGDASNNTTDDTKPTYTIKFDNGDIIDLAGKTIYPFVVCNPNADLIGELTTLGKGDKSFADKIVSTAPDGSFFGWLNNNFLMTNAFIDTTEGTGTGIEMPAAAQLQAYTKPSNPFNLTGEKGAIKVERSVARMDFRNTKLADAPEANMYTIYTDATDRKDIVGYVTLTHMALINQAKQFYAFRRVSPNGQESNSTVGGIETPANFIVSPDASNLSARTFTLPAFDSGNALAPSGFSYTPILDVTGTGTGYQIWRYVTENAIPAPASNQTKGLTTGVVFKGSISFPESSPLAAMAAAGDNLYKFGSVIYGNFDALVDEIKANPNTLLAAKAKNAGLYTGIDADGNLLDLKDESTVNAASGTDLSANGFTVYRKAADGTYPVYYYYWNRHNDNGDPNKMGAMEFGVVRNNVYKLAVTNISEFGHPGDPGDDPKPEDPDDDDETVDLYIKLDVKVLPWTVRVNNIEF